MISFFISSCIQIVSEDVSESKNGLNDSVESNQVQSFRDIKFSPNTDINFSQKLDLQLSFRGSLSRQSAIFRIFSSSKVGEKRLIITSNIDASRVENLELELPIGTKNLIIHTYNSSGRLITQKTLRKNKNKILIDI